MSLKRESLRLYLPHTSIAHTGSPGSPRPGGPIGPGLPVKPMSPFEQRHILNTWFTVFICITYKHQLRLLFFKTVILPEYNDSIGTPNLLNPVDRTSIV